MAFAKKSKRRITVGDQAYFWSCTGDDGWISVWVGCDVQGGQRLSCSFDYHQDVMPSGPGRWTVSNQFVVTPYIVRQVIDHALAQGWTPLSGGGELQLGSLDGLIDLRLDQNREEPIRARGKPT